MRDEYLGPFWADHHGRWSAFAGGAIRRIAILPGILARRGPAVRRRSAAREA